MTGDHLGPVVWIPTGQNRFDLSQGRETTLEMHCIADSEISAVD